MESVFAIFEEYYGEGYIGVAKTYEDAINFLIEKKYLVDTLWVGVFNENGEWVTDKPIKEAYSLEDLNEIKKWDIDVFNEVFIDQLHISKEKIYSEKG